MSTRPFPSFVRRVVLRPAAFLLLTLAFALAAPPPSGAVEAREVLRYDLFTNRPFGNNGEDIQAAAGPDGQVLVVWTEWDTATSEQTSYGQWLAPDGTPSGEAFRVASRASVTRVAVAPGRRAIAIVYEWVGDTPYRVVALQGERVIRRGSLPEPDCSYVEAATATERGWFVACQRWAFPEPMRRPGLWLDPAGRVRHEVEIGPGYELAVAGGIRDQVALVYTDAAGSPLLARWITPRRSGPVMVVDPSTDVGLFAPSVTHLRDRVFAVSWLAEWASGTDGEDFWRSTTVQEATFRAPDVVRAERKFSPPSAGIHPGPVSEHREPFVLRTGDREQLVGWFGCQYGSSPGGRLCFRHDGLYLRARRDAGPAGPVIALPDVAWNARVVYTGDLLLTATLVRKALNEDRWSLEIRGWEVE